MARDDEGEIPNPWERAKDNAYAHWQSTPPERACVGGPLHRDLMPEDQITFVLEEPQGPVNLVTGTQRVAMHTYRLMRDVQSGELCYVHMGAVVLERAEDGYTLTAIGR